MRLEIDIVIEMISLTGLLADERFPTVDTIYVDRLEFPLCIAVSMLLVPR